MTSPATLAIRESILVSASRVHLQALSRSRHLDGDHLARKLTDMKRRD
jgi:hypothetical protein